VKTWPHRLAIQRSAGKIASAIALCLLVAACADQPAQRSRPSINLSGYSPAFREGFADGCETARGNHRRNEKRFGEDRQYAQGWGDGRSICVKR